MLLDLHRNGLVYQDLNNFGEHGLEMNSAK